MQTIQDIDGIKRNKEQICFVVKKKVAPSIEVPEKMKPVLEEFKEVVHDELPEELLPMRDNQHHGTSILHGCEELFLW